jgi:hypothetical protein
MQVEIKDKKAKKGKLTEGTHKRLERTPHQAIPKRGQPYLNSTPDSDDKEAWERANMTK